jgi:hypothetical protein
MIRAPHTADSGLMRGRPGPLIYIGIPIAVALYAGLAWLLFGDW